MQSLAVALTLTASLSLHVSTPARAAVPQRRCAAPVLQQTPQEIDEKIKTETVVRARMHTSFFCCAWDDSCLASSLAHAQGVVVPTNPDDSSFSYVAFAQQYPFANNIAIATAKTAAADLLAQVVIAQTPVDAIDWQRAALFMLFGATYLGGFQYLYQVQVFKKLFDVDSFTSQPWADKLRDGPGLRALAAQVALDLTVLTLVYLPTFYVFKAGVFHDPAVTDPAQWVAQGLGSYQANFAKDEVDLLKVGVGRLAHHVYCMWHVACGMCYGGMRARSSHCMLVVAYYGPLYTGVVSGGPRLLLGAALPAAARAPRRLLRLDGLPLVCTRRALRRAQAEARDPTGLAETWLQRHTVQTQGCHLRDVRTLRRRRDSREHQ